MKALFLYHLIELSEWPGPDWNPRKLVLELVLLTTSLAQNLRN